MSIFVNTFMGTSLLFSYLKVDSGILAGAIEDAFLLGPLYVATGVGLWLRRPGVIPVGLITGAMIFYAIIGFLLGDIFAGLPSVTNDVSYWASNLPYLIYPLWLIPVLLFRRSLFVRKEADTSAMGAKHRPLRPNAGYEAEPD